MPFSEIDDASVEPMASWFYDQSSDGFAISRKGVILKVNQAWCDILGIRREDAVGQTAADILAKSDLENYAQREANLLELGEDEFEVHLNTSRGGVWLKGSIKRGADGYALIAARDVTAERRIVEEQQAAANIHGLLRGGAGVLTWRFSPASDQFFVDASRDASEATYLPVASEVALQDMLQQVDEGEREGLLKALLASVDTGEPGENSFRHSTLNGRRTCFRACWRGLRREGDGRWQLAGLTQDHTDLMEARDAALAGEQEAKEADRVKSQFLANMSHELRTPLNGVLGVLHLLKREAMSEGAKNLLAEAELSGRMLTALLNDLLDLSHLDAGRLSLSHEAVDPSILVQGVLSLYRPEFESKGLSVHMVMPTTAPTVVIDPIRLRQILSSLIGNAAKFTSHGGATVRLLLLGEGNEHRLRIEVEDTGIGIEPETMRFLFTPFQQGDAATTRQFGGAGLGLALSRNLAGLMGGEVGGSSELGHGSTFWVEVPSPLASNVGAELEEDAPFYGLSVLVVDDNATNRLVAEKILEQLGAVVDTASDGALAVAAVADAAFDLVLMDIQMPVMDGIEATMKIRALPAPIGQIPIVAMTANVSPEQIKSYKAAGMNGVIAKPVSPSAIISEIIRVSTGDLEPSVYRLAYHSRACPDVATHLDETLSDILKVSIRWNESINVTGALLGCEGWFLQILEGPRQSVEDIFEIIAADHRHEEVTVMNLGDVDGRKFGQWSMCGMHLSQTNINIVGFLGSGGLFDPPTLSEQEAMGILMAVSDLQKAEVARQ